MDRDAGSHRTGSLGSHLGGIASGYISISSGPLYHRVTLLVVPGGRVTRGPRAASGAAASTDYLGCLGAYAKPNPTQTCDCMSL